MLTREAILAVDMSVQRPLHRSSWKAEAIRRGDIKISGPIPIIQDVPLNDEEEAKFVEKTSFDDSFQRQEATEQQSQRPETPPVPSEVPSRIPSALRSNPVEIHVPQEEEPPQPQREAPTSPPQERQELEVRPASIMAEPASSPMFAHTVEVTSKAAQKKKRKSGLRQVFRKMFGRKSRDESEVHQPATLRKGHGYHHSVRRMIRSKRFTTNKRQDPGMLSQSSPRELQAPTGIRISDLTVQEPKPPHPLGQHLPFPMNVNAPQASPPQEYLTFDHQRPRRVTLPGLSGGKMQRRSLDEVRGRSSVWSDGQDEESLHSPGIGIAFSSPTQATTPKKSNRRSRSAGALQDLAKDQLPSDRRRSAEIRYWRASYGSGSLYSRPETAKTIETVRNVQAQEPTIQEQGSESVLEMSATLVHADDEEMHEQVGLEPDRERETEAPESAFNFGNLKSGFSDEEGAPVPRDPIEAPSSPVQLPESLPIEDRVQHLENKCENLASTVRRLSTRNNRHTIILENAPKNLRSRNRSTSSRSIPASRSQPSPSVYQESVQPGSSIIVPSAASPVFGKDGEVTLESVCETLKHEREARKTLEIQVKTLQQDVSDLHALINRLVTSGITTSPSYPTPSPDAIVASTENRLLTPRGIVSESLDPQHAKANDDIRASAISKFSYSETGSESGQEEDVNELRKQSTEGSVDDLASPDVWATPKEEKFAGNGFFYGKRSRDNLKGFI